MEQQRRLALSLFSGAGGMDIGVQQASFEILCAVERDPHCCETLRANVAREGLGTRIMEADVRNVEPVQLMAELGLPAGRLDLLFGGPPCQAFSQIGKMQGLDDERGLLLFEMTRFAKVFQPKVVLIEQVTGLLSAKDGAGRRGGILEMLLDELAEAGYVSKWEVINAADLGVAERRRRVFIVATRGHNGFVFPEATHAAPERITPIFALKPYVGVGQAIAGLGEPGHKNGEPREDSHVDVTPDGDRFRIHGVPEGSHLAAQVHLPKKQRRGLTRKDTTKFLRLSRARPANTLRCGEIFFHPTEDRYMTPREYMSIHGFPRDYVLKGPIRGRSGRVRTLDQHRQVANSVPPPVARALAERIAGLLSCHKSSKSSDTQ